MVFESTAKRLRGSERLIEQRILLRAHVLDLTQWRDGTSELCKTG
jgi:hypothetical protein